jgi:hydroxymethylpyrimidine/phosphomethylpyrimidine kinase
MPTAPPIVLSIAGFDPSSGAGVTADVKTIAAHGCYALTSITAITVQSGRGVRRVEPVAPFLVQQMLEELADDVEIDAVHIGMLGSAGVAEKVAAFLQSYRLPNVVLDPVLQSSSGADLLDHEGVTVLLTKLLPLADVITPNIDEAAALTGRAGSNLQEMKEAAIRLHGLGARAVVVTGGHLDPAVDLLSRPGGILEFPGPHLESSSTHGTGCAFSTALACRLALGSDLPAGVRLAKQYVKEAISYGYPVGNGPGPLNHFYDWEKQKTQGSSSS